MLGTILHSVIKVLTIYVINNEKFPEDVLLASQLIRIYSHQTDQQLLHQSCNNHCNTWQSIDPYSVTERKIQFIFTPCFMGE